MRIITLVFFQICLQNLSNRNHHATVINSRDIYGPGVFPALARFSLMGPHGENLRAFAELYGHGVGWGRMRQVSPSHSGASWRGKKNCRKFQLCRGEGFQTDLFGPHTLIQNLTCTFLKKQNSWICLSTGQKGWKNAWKNTQTSEMLDETWLHYSLRFFLLPHLSSTICVRLVGRYVSIVNPHRTRFPLAPYTCTTGWCLPFQLRSPIAKSLPNVSILPPTI